MISTISLLLCLFLFGGLDIASAGTFENGKLKHVRFGFILQNMKATVLPLATLHFYAPVDETSRQKTISVNVSVPHSSSLDASGNRVILVTMKDIPPFATRIITVDTELLFTEQPVKKKDNPIEQYLKSEKNIESSHPDIQRRAKELKKETPLATARNIFNWVAKSVQYSGYRASARGALDTLHSRSGDCTEYMLLFIALCRANGIPARGVGGYLCKKDCFLSPALYHDWAEFYHDNAWRVADPQRKVFMQDESSYVAMRLMGYKQNGNELFFYRYAVSGDGLTVKMMN